MNVWWERERVAALLRDLIRAEWRRLRPGADPMPDAPRFDSLERLQVASRVADFFQLRAVGLEDRLLSGTTLDDWVATVCDSLARNDRVLGFHTSGSTGESVLHVHELTELEREIDHWAALLAPVALVAGVVPRHHLYGFLFTVLLPWRLNVPFLEARDLLPARLVATLPANALVIGYPDYWRLIADCSPRFPPRTQGLTSTAPCPDALSQRLVPSILARLVQIYGSTETGGIGWRDAPAAPYLLLPHWQRADDALYDPQTDRRVVPPDRLDWQDARHFRLGGRHDRAVQIGGVNVYPERVARWLASQPEVAAAAVRPMRADEGTRLKAFVVPADARADRIERIEQPEQPDPRAIFARGVMTVIGIGGLHVPRRAERRVARHHREPFEADHRPDRDPLAAGPLYGRALEQVAVRVQLMVHALAAMGIFEIAWVEAHPCCSRQASTISPAVAIQARPSAAIWRSTSSNGPMRCGWPTR